MTCLPRFPIGTISVYCIIMTLGSIHDRLSTRLSHHSSLRHWALLTLKRSRRPRSLQSHIRTLSHASFLGSSPNAAGQSLAVTEVTARQNAPTQGWSTGLIG